MKGHSCSEELKRKMSLLYKGKKRTLTPEAREKMSLGRKGKRITKEHKQALVKANIGRVKSEEEKAKISLGKIGSNNPSWKGGVSRATHKIRGSHHHKWWSRKVKQKDKYTCQLCFAKEEKLTAHHIYSFKNHPILRFIVNNGMTLCVPCHEVVHHGIHMIA